MAAMTKRSVNQMQDLQGFRNHVVAAHSTYMQMQLGGKVAPRDEAGQDPPPARRGPVAGERRRARADRQRRGAADLTADASGQIVTRGAAVVCRRCWAFRWAR